MPCLLPHVGDPPIMLPPPPNPLGVTPTVRPGQASDQHRQASASAAPHALDEHEADPFAWLEAEFPQLDEPWEIDGQGELLHPW